MPSKDIRDTVKLIQNVWDNIRIDYANIVPGKYLVLTCTYRSPEEQNGLFMKGRIKGSDGKTVIQDKAKIVTNVDGITILGAHNYKPARAIDVMVVDNMTGKETWEERYYWPLTKIASQYRLEHGGTWKSFKDWPHLQVPNYKTYTEV